MGIWKTIKAAFGRGTSTPPDAGRLSAVDELAGLGLDADGCGRRARGACREDRMRPLPTCSTPVGNYVLDKYADAHRRGLPAISALPIFNLQIWITSIAVVFDPLVQISKFLCIVTQALG